jgi:hypothetical protein
VAIAASPTATDLRERDNAVLDGVEASPSGICSLVTASSQHLVATLFSARSTDRC